MHKIFFHIAIFTLVLGFSSAIVIAQDSTSDSYVFEFRGEKMAVVLDHIARNSELDLVYDPELVEGITVYKRLRHQNQGDLLSDLLNDYRLDYITLSSGTIVIVRIAEEDPSYGTYAGKIVDRETGEPLPGATVLLADASGGTSTNHSGTFSMNRVMSGSYQIIISYLGYESMYKTIDIHPGQNVQERIFLTPKPVDVAPVIVEAHRPGLPSANKGPEARSGQDWIQNGGLQTPIRSLSLVSGVQYGLPMTDLHLQGGQQSEHRMLLDGIPVYNPYSFGRMFTSFSPHAIGSIQLHRAGYGVEQGSQTAGLIGLSHEHTSDDENRLLLQGDPLSLNLRGDLSIPVKGESNVNVMTAIRTNYWDVYRSPTLEKSLQKWDVIDPLITNMLVDLDGNDASDYSPVYHDSNVDFMDLHMAVDYDPNEFSSIQASFYTAENAVQTDLLNQSESGQSAPYLFASDSHYWTNLMSQIKWSRMVTPRLDLSVQGAYSKNRFDHTNTTGTSSFNPFPRSAASAFLGSESSTDYNAIGEAYRPLPSQIDGNSIEHFLTRSDLSYSITPSFSVDAGIQFDHVNTDVEISDLSYQAEDSRQSSGHISSYFKNRHTLGSKWRLDYGSRFTHLNRTGRIYAEPRASVQFDEPDAAIGYWSVRLAGGLYRQFINEYRITNVGATSIVPDFSIWSHAIEDEIPKSYHLTGSFLTEPTSQTSISLEGYYKWQPVTTITSYSNQITGFEADNSEVSAFAETTEMTTFGGGFRVNQSTADSRIRLMAGYDYSFTQLDMSTQFGKTLPAPWSEPHRAQMRTMFRFLPNVTAVVAWQGIWGRSWGFRQSYYNYLRFRESESLPGFSFDDPSDNKLDSFQQVDLSVIYRPTLGNIEMDMRLELINILNRKNILEQSLVPVAGENGNTGYEIRNRYMPGFYPSASIQVRF